MKAKKSDLTSLPTNVPDAIRKAIAGEDEYSFLSEDGNWKASLTKEFIALTCINYTDYGEFEARLTTVLKIFDQVYEPGYFTRIGLRYRNLANASVLGKEKTDNLREFIPPMIAPELQNAIGDEVEAFEKTIIYADTLCNANVRYIFSELSGIFGSYKINNELSYIIDIDCFTEEKERNVASVIRKSRLFNEEYVRNIFHAATTPTLHAAMEPLPRAD
ncbi:MAG: hypothetical protein NPIRA04_16440 [Nitrospirales bacterium]|nr:MAG: hypothetical protein NPIRA04_16440 [Nitrospirales bacterium]